MPVTEHVQVKKLKLDLANYRTIKQANETEAITAIIAINPDWFFALAESLIEDGYLPTENVLVQQSGTAARPILTVKEGNRRIAALKLIHGYLSPSDFQLPSHLVDKMNAISVSYTHLTLPTTPYV